MKDSFKEKTGSNPDPLQALAGLQAHDMDSWRAEMVRRKTQVQLKRSVELANKRWLVITRKVYRATLEPTFLATVSSAYLIWAFQTVSALLGM